MRKALIPLLFLLYPLIVWAANYSDDFTGYTGSLGDQANWRITSGDITCGGGNCSGTSSSAFNHALWDSGQMDTSGYEVQVDVSNITSSGNKAGVIIASNSAGTDYIGCVYEGEWSGNGLYIVDENESVLANTSSQAWGTAATLRCWFDESGNVRLTLNDANETVATAPANPGAYVGLYGGWSSQGTFDNWSASDFGVTGPSAALLRRRGR